MLPELGIAAPKAAISRWTRSLFSSSRMVDLAASRSLRQALHLQVLPSHPLAVNPIPDALGGHLAVEVVATGDRQALLVLLEKVELLGRVVVTCTIRGVEFKQLFGCGHFAPSRQLPSASLWGKGHAN